MLSVIIPTFNEIKNGYIQTTFNLLKNLSGAEIICVDSGSTDGTKELIIKSGFKLISVDTTSRAKRLNTGIQHAKGDMLLLHHPRSLLSVDSFAELQNNQEDLYWGAFTHKFDLNHPLLKFTSWWSNKVRGDLRHIFYLDHCLFIRKEIFEDMGLIPEVDIFEDTELSLMLKSYCVPLRLEGTSLTSATRFSTNGIWKQALLNQVLKWKYYFKFNHKEMNKSYEKNTKLNSDYTTKD